MLLPRATAKIEVDRPRADRGRGQIPLRGRRGPAASGAAVSLRIGPRRVQVLSHLEIRAPLAPDKTRPGRAVEDPTLRERGWGSPSVITGFSQVREASRSSRPAVASRSPAVLQGRRRLEPSSWARGLQASLLVAASIRRRDQTCRAVDASARTGEEGCIGTRCNPCGAVDAPRASLTKRGHGRISTVRERLTSPGSSATPSCRRLHSQNCDACALE